MAGPTMRYLCEALRGSGPREAGNEGKGLVPIGPSSWGHLRKPPSPQPLFLALNTACILLSLPTSSAPHSPHPPTTSTLTLTLGGWRDWPGWTLLMLSSRTSKELAAVVWANWWLPERPSEGKIWTFACYQLGFHQLCCRLSYTLL